MFLNYRKFENRKDAGIELGKKLERQYKNQHTLILGIPRGGVEVAYEVAQILYAEMSVIVSKKLPFPGQEELAFGAIAEDGSVFISNLGKRVDEQETERIKAKQLQEIGRRVQEYRNGAPLPDMAYRTVILVDDGIATGSTIVPALRLCRKRNAAKIIVAAPVSGNNFVPELRELADEIIVTEVPEDFYAVGQAYEDFHPMTDKEVTDILRRYESEQKNII